MARSKQVQTVVVIQTAKLGDMVCTTPTFRALKKQMPEVKLVVVGLPSNQALLTPHPDVDLYVPFARNVFTLMRVLRAHNPGAIFICNQNVSTLAASILSGCRLVVAPRIVGGTTIAPRSYRVLVQRVVSVVWHFNVYVPAEHLKLLHEIGLTETDTTKHLAYTKQAREVANDLLREWGVEQTNAPVVGLSLTAGNKIKQWPIERFARLAEQMQTQYGAHLIILGGPGDEACVAAFREQCSATYFEAAGASARNLDELKALIDRLDLYVAVDTGPIYIAEAFGTPTIDIVGPVSEVEQPPRGDQHFVVVPERTEPALHIFNARIYDKDEALRQLLSITVADVMSVVARAFEVIETRSKSREML